MEETHPGRRVAVGGARLLLRELTLEADRITLRVVEGEDLHLTARGCVSFVSTQRDRVTREEGVEALVIRNDEVTPLR